MKTLIKVKEFILEHFVQGSYFLFIASVLGLIGLTILLVFGLNGILFLISLIALINFWAWFVAGAIQLQKVKEELTALKAVRPQPQPQQPPVVPNP
jgi:membrane protein implicated in regulation of membrane protease activity